MKTPEIGRLIGRLFPDALQDFIRRPDIRYGSHFQRLQRLIAYSPAEEALRNAIDFVRFSSMTGDYLEFGVFQGDAFRAAFHLAQTADLAGMRFHAFDSFAGLPGIRGLDAAGFQHFAQGEFQCDEDTFRQRLERGGVDLSRITVTPGWFNETLTPARRRELAIDRAAVIYVDCDLYESTVPVLDFITDLIQQGTVLVFDDWHCFRGDPRRGEQRAMREWLERNPHLGASEFHAFGWQLKSFILHRLDQSSG